MKRAVFPGSFDPFTLGHEDIIRRALPLFDEIVVAVGVNTDKKYMFSLERRKFFVNECYGNHPKIKINTYQGLTTDYCKQVNADFILRGLRNPADFEFEKAIAETNRNLSGIETVFLLTSAKTAFISSSIVRDVYRHGGSIAGLVPESVVRFTSLEVEAGKSKLTSDGEL